LKKGQTMDNSDSTVLEKTGTSSWTLDELPVKLQAFEKGRVALILEKKEDVDLFTKVQNSFRGDLTVLAVSPDVCWELEKLGARYLPVEHFSSDDDLLSLGRENYRMVEEICTDIDASFSSASDGEGNVPLKPGWDNFFYIKILYDAITVRLRIILDLATTLNPDLVICCSTGSGRKERPYTQLVPFEKDERMYAMLLGLPKIPFRTITISMPRADSPGTGDVPEPGRIRSFITRIRSFITRKGREIPFLLQAFFIFKHHGARGLLSFLSNRIMNIATPRKILFLVGSGYSWEYAALELAGHGYDLETVSGICVPDDDKLLQRRGGPDTRVSKNRLQYQGIDFSPLFTAKLDPVIQRTVLFTGFLSKEFEGIIRKRKPHAIITATHSTACENLVCRIASHHTIPVITWQHGSQGFANAPMPYYEELMNTHVYLCFGRGVKEMFDEDPFNHFDSRIVEVGSCELEDLDKKMQKPCLEPGTVLYATNNYYANIFYISPGTLLHDIDFWATQKKIIKVLGDNAIGSIVKLHPSQYPEQHFTGFVCANRYSTITIVKDQTEFSALLDHSDVVIIDFPSTVLLQAIAAKKVVFVLLKHQKLSDHATDLLRKRAYCSDDIDEFSTMIGNYLNNQPLDQHPDIGNTGFLEAFGVHRLDGNVVNRAIDVLDNLPLDGGSRERLKGQPVLNQ